MSDDLETTKKKTKVTVESKTNDFLSAVMYCDGGASPGNPGPGGYGIHIYLWDTFNVNLNTFRKGKRATVSGYETKDIDDEKKRVSPSVIINSCGVVAPYFKTTNNVAELMACIRGLTILNNYKEGDKEVKSILVISDSRYMLDKLEAIAKTPKEKRRIVLLKPNRNGQPRPNQTETLELLAAFEALDERGVKIKCNWVKGHNGNTGNELADTLATFATWQANQIMGRSKHLLPVKDLEHVKITTAEEFWHSDKNNFVNSIPLIAHTNVAYSYDSEDYVPRETTIDGIKKYVYMLSSEADEYREEKKAPPRTGTSEDEDAVDDDDEKDDEDEVINELSGETKLGDEGYPKVAGRLGHYKARTTRALVFLNEPLKILDDLMNIYREHIPLRNFVLNDLVLFKLNAINNSKFMFCNSVCGTAAIEMQDNYLDKTVYPLSRASMNFDKDYLSLHVSPQKVSLYILEHFCEINKCSQEYFNNKEALAGIEDITDVFYTTCPKGKTILRPEFKVGHRRTPIVHKTKDGDGKENKLPIVLVSNIHIPDRNALKRLEEHSPQIKLVSKILHHATNSFCSYIFYVVIESDIGIGIYMAEMSNMIISILTPQ